MEPIRVGIAGLGRSGWGIHTAVFRALPEHYRIVAAMDPDESRRREAAEVCGARPHERFEDLVADPQVELLVVATPNSAHCEHVTSALRAGKHVVCEKPFGISAAEADAMIEAAKKARRVVAPFQNRRFEPHFQKVREVLASGVLGEVHLIRLCVQSFGRRWDWQTLRKFSGGQLTNWGPHVIDHALQLLEVPDGQEPEMWVDMRNLLSSGDAEDAIKIVLRRPSGGPVVDVELSAASAYTQDRWFIAGRNGGLRGTTTHIEWKWVDWSSLPPRPVEDAPTTVARSYSQEQLEWHSDQWSADPNSNDADLSERFYRSLYATLRQNSPLEIAPEAARQQIAVIERAKLAGGFA